MKRRIIGAVILLFGLLIPSAVLASGFNKAGRTTFQFVKIGIGARQTAIGEASIALVNDVNSTFWNPAGIGGIQSAEASFSYSRWFAGMNYLSGAIGLRMGNTGTLALGISSLKYGDISEALSVGGVSDTRTGNTFTGSDLMISASFAHHFSEALWIGVTGKFLQEKLYIYSSSLAAFDVGTCYNTGFKGIRFAMSFQNFGKSVKYLSVSDREEGYDIPLVYRVGLATDLIGGNDGFLNLGDEHRFTLCLESVNSNDYGDRWHVGGEYAFDNFLFVRGGYRINYDEGNLSFGIGLCQKIAENDVRLDFSYVSYRYLDSPYRFTLSVGF